MKSFSARSIALCSALGVSLAACSGGGGSLRMTPGAQPIQSETHMQNGGRCKTLPLINAKTPALNAGPRKDVIDFNCGIRSFHKTALRANSGNFQVFDVPDAIQVSNCSSNEVFNDCGTFGIAMNASNTIVGYYLNDSDEIASYFRAPGGGKYTTFQATQNQATFSYDIADSGAIAGQYFDAHGVSHGFVRNKGGSFLRFEAPWASQNPDDSVSQGTSAGMVNAKGESAGIYSTLRAYLTDSSATTADLSFKSSRTGH
jgi:hypothetical protein